MGIHNDAVDESKLLLCCALCCVNISLLTSCSCIGCSGKAGIFCCNFECCCKPDAPCLCPCGIVGCKPDCESCSLVNAQCQACCVVASAALPCSEEVPVAVSIAGLTLFPTCGCCVKQSTIMQR